MQRFTLMFAAIAGALLTATSAAASHRAPLINATTTTIASTNACEAAVGRSPTPSEGLYRRSPSPAFRRWALNLWRGRLAECRRAIPPHHSLWLCIHSSEAQSWADPNSGGNGHYGGLQMTPGWNHAFVGTADRFSQLEQEWIAERGYREHGYDHTWLMGQWNHPGCLYAA